MFHDDSIVFKALNKVNQSLSALLQNTVHQSANVDHFDNERDSNRPNPTTLSSPTPLMVDSISIELGHDLILIGDEEEEQSIVPNVRKVRKDLLSELGFITPLEEYRFPCVAS